MLAFVILHYIVVEETITCVRSILENVSGDKKIIIVDNASPNNSFLALKDYFSDNEHIIVLHSPENIGFARGNNLGYDYAVKNFSPNFIIVMNNDMEIHQKNFTEELNRSYITYDYFTLGPDIYSTQKKYHQNPQTRTLLSKEQLKHRYKKLIVKYAFRFLIPVKWWLKRKFHPNSIKKIEDKSNIPFVNEVVENPMLHGSCYIFSKKFIDKYPNKCFYDKTFMYLEAEVFYYLALKRNEKMIYYPFLMIDHHEDVSTDVAYKKQYEKSIFSIKCLLQSTKAFIDLI